jgi:cell division protein FtsB
MTRLFPLEGTIIKKSAPKTSPRSAAGPQRRLGFVLCAILVCLLGSWMGVQAAHPFLLAGRYRDRNDALERQVKQFQLKNQRAEREVKALDTDQGLLRAARKFGWVLPGEQKLRIPNR